MSRVAAVAFAAAAAMLVGAIAVLPPRATSVAAPSWKPARPSIAGAFHVHTNRSDGTGSIDEVAVAARRAGLTFVVLTDHGDGTRALEAPSYRSGVLMIDGVEISTAGGHYAAVGMTPSSYPLGGEAQDVVEDVMRLGGFGIASHGDSPKPDLRWANRSSDVDAIEWLNLETVWRQATATQIARASIAYWFRRPETLALAIARPAATLDWLDAVGRRRRVVSVAATDAHGALQSSYEACFKTVSTRVDLPAPLSGNAALDAQAVIAALRSGNHFSAVDALAAPVTFEFVGRLPSREVRPGEVVSASEPLQLEARVSAPDGAVLTLLRDGRVVRHAAGRIAYGVDGQPGAYRVEVRLASGPTVPWVVSNAIFVGLTASAIPEALSGGERVDLIAPAVGRPTWHTEGDPSSMSQLLRPEPSALALRFALGGGAPRDQFAAIVLPVPSDFGTYDRLVLRARASAPLRLSVQLRDLGNQNPPRWRRSVYLDGRPREATVFFREMTPVPPNLALVAQHQSTGGLLLLVDTTNTRPGTAGEIVFSSLALEGERSK